MGTSDKPGDKRQQRLEAELRANLKKRKDQAKARERSAGADDAALGDAPDAVKDGGAD